MRDETEIRAPLSAHVESRTRSRWACAVGAVLVAALLVQPATAGRDRAVDTLQLTAAFTLRWHLTDCPAGTPATTNCYLYTGKGIVPGLGAAEESWITIVDDFGSACPHLHGLATITVTGKGDVEAGLQLVGCAPTDHPPNRSTPLAFTITGGSGAYAGATGDGTYVESPTETGAGSGGGSDNWTGTLSVGGLSFDVTPPAIAGAVNRLVTTKGTGARVTYTLTASDDGGGAVSLSCLPPSGSRFPAGRTAVNCTAADTNGNAASARFFVTVKRIRR